MTNYFPTQEDEPFVESPVPDILKKDETLTREPVTAVQPETPVAQTAESPPKEETPVERKLREFLSGNKAKESVIQNHVLDVISLKVKDLPDAIARNPNHPIAKAFQRAVDQMSPGTIIAVCVQDLQALIEGKRIATTTTRDPQTGVDTIRKIIV